MTKIKILQNLNTENGFYPIKTVFDFDREFLKWLEKNKINRMVFDEIEKNN